MRSFIRHPSDIPIDFQVEERGGGGSEHLKDISHGGLSFHSNTYLSPGAVIRISISLVKPVFQALAQVTWCEPEATHYDVGVEFLDDDDVFRARMVEQICHIEHYKQQVFEEEGRILTGEQAAQEWIRRFAPDFPAPDEEDGDRDA